MGSPQPKRKCCCDTECDNCTTCPGEFDTVYVVLAGTTNDGTYNAVWDPVNSWWDIDFGVCTTVMECASGGGVSWTLFNDQDCPIGGTCTDGSPLVITPAPDCDNCDMDLPSGTLSIHWTCGGEALPLRMPLQAATVEGQRECIHRGEQIGEHVCEPCGIKGTILPVYQCNLLEKPCVWRWWTNVGAKRAASGEVACNTCRERTLADGTKPWDQAK